ncbi:MAG: class II aldolase/adducin family protein [Burkholderiales bacterium]
MNKLEQFRRDIVIANRILAHEGVVDAYGHVSARHPDNPNRYVLSRSRSPELVTEADLMEFDLEGNVIGADDRPPYLERFIHGAIYEARPDVMAVVHSHAEEVLPWTIVSKKLRPVVHTASCLGGTIPNWDIRDKFGDTYHLLVVNCAQGRDLAKKLDVNNVVLMRGHGFAAAARSIKEVVRMAVYMPKNAKTYAEALKLGEVTPMSDGELAIKGNADPDAPEWWRAWEYWARRAGCADLLAKR